MPGNFFIKRIFIKLNNDFPNIPADELMVSLKKIGIS